MDFRKPTVIVTGASRGIGAAAARWLGKMGAGVVLVARSTEGLENVASEVKGLGGGALIVAGDVADPTIGVRTVEETLLAFGRIDAVVNNAGSVEPLAMVAVADPLEWKRCVEVNLMGPCFMVRAALPELRKTRGRIVNVSSGAATHSILAASAYCAAKAGLNHFTRVLAEEEPSIVSVAVRPGVVDTAMQEVLREKGLGAMPWDHAAYYVNLKKEGRLEPPSIPARSIVWLALHAPPSVSGAFLSYDDPELFQKAARSFGEWPQ